MEDSIRRILDRVPGWQAANCTLAPLTGGMTNRNFKVIHAGEAFVLRLGGEGTELLGINRRHEYRASVLAAHVGVGAEVIGFFAEEKALVTRFIEGTAISSDHAGRPEMLRRVAASLRRYHQGVEFPGWFWPPDVIRNYHQLALARGVVFPTSSPRVFELMQEMEIALGKPKRPVPCHNDLLAANFIDDGQTLRILDWEYAAMGDLFFDLGNFSVNQRLSPERRELFLGFYLDRVTDVDRARLELMRLWSDLREAFWGFLQSGISSLDVDFCAYGLEHWQRFEKNVAASEYQDWLKTVKG